MEIHTVKCDGCGIQKGDTNHWHKACVETAGFVLVPWTNETEFPQTVHLCSDSCVVKIVQQWLSSQKEGSDADRRDAEGVERAGSEVGRTEEVSKVREDG